MKPAKPKIRQVLLDASFVNALLATDVAEHDDACALYGMLVERYENGLDRLFALSTVLGDVPRQFRRSALAPVLTLYVSRQHRSAAGKVAEAGSAQTALSLVMMRRERIRTVVTASHDFDPFEIEVITVASSVPAPSDEQIPAGYVPYEPVAVDVDDRDRDLDRDELSSRTAPTTAQRSTGE